MDIKPKTRPDVITAQARRIRWQHGLTPRMARIVAGLAYGGVSQ